MEKNIGDVVLDRDNREWTIQEKIRDEQNGAFDYMMHNKETGEAQACRVKDGDDFVFLMRKN